MNVQQAVHNRAAGRARRLFALVAVAFLAVMFLTAAGHAARHLHEQLPCDDCPVCLHLSALARSAFGVLPLFAALALRFHSGRCLVGRYGQLVWPMVESSTPVSEKIKLTI